MATLGSESQRGEPVGALRVRVCPRNQQQLHHVLSAQFGCFVQSRPLIGTAQIDVGSVADQQGGHVIAVTQNSWEMGVRWAW